MLTAKQYHQAKNAVFGYEALWRITPANPRGRALTPQHPASSQKIFLGPRKPPTRVEPTVQQPAVVAAEEVAQIRITFKLAETSEASGLRNL